jgi:hypothetical protein
MTTIQTTIEISEDRHLRMDLTIPEGFPTSKAKLLVFIGPHVEGKPLAPLSEPAGCPKDSPNFAGNPMEVQPKVPDYG